MTAALSWRGRCLAQGKSLQAGRREGGYGYTGKQGRAYSENLAAMSESHGAVMPSELSSGGRWIPL